MLEVSAGALVLDVLVEALVDSVEDDASAEVVASPVAWSSPPQASTANAIAQGHELAIGDLHERLGITGTVAENREGDDEAVDAVDARPSLEMRACGGSPSIGSRSTRGFRPSAG